MDINKLTNIIKEEINTVLKETYGSTEELAKKNINGNTEKFIAYNESYWQWEYDMSVNHAFLYWEQTSGELRLVIINEHVKSGIGAGRRFTNQVDENVGTLIKPQLAKIRTLLKQHSHMKTRAGYPFRRLWKNPNKNYQEQELASILKEYQNV